ncbi:protein kinase domain-containing protein [Streptomyces sp. NPDC002817]|uniref:protein kinase domain-containing protein n=1 Tax=Streptomyces sp. NPDC088357 TaxID=3154655 RepID=UPI00342C96E0
MTDQRHPTPPYRTALIQAGADPLQPADPARIGPYVPLGRLGSGGMGRVFLARPADDSAGLAAVKVIRPEYAEDPEFRRRFEREAAVHGRVDTPHAPRLLGTGFEHELLWMATQYVPGINLADAVRHGGRLEPTGVWRLVTELGRALSALAAAGVVHRDLKPSNVLLSTRGVHVIDFGISQAVDSSAITGTGSRVGTPAFMSPEYLREGRCDGASDVFSLAGTLIYAATGHAPFGDGTGVDVMHRVAFEEPKAEVMSELGPVDGPLATLLTACLAKDPAGRPTPKELIAAAATALKGEAPAWQEPLAGRLLDRQEGCDLLEAAPAEQTVHLRAPTTPAVTPAPGPGFGPATPPGAYGATPPRAYGPATPPGAYGAAPAGAYEPATPPGQYASGENEARRNRKKPALALAAGLAVVAVAAGAFFLTRPSHDETASAAPTASTSTGPASDAEGASALPGTSASASPSTAEEKKGQAMEEEEEQTESDGGTSGSDDGTAGTPSATAAPGGTGGTSGGGAPTPTATVTETATAPADPAWISDCTYYSGTELTKHGDKGQRVVQVQCMLTKRGYSVGDAGVDGRFGNATLAAVKQFQGAKGLEVDGKVGPQTWAALRSST